MNVQAVSRDVERLRQFWAARYRDFSLGESGWRGAGERFNALVYRCKAQTLRAALRAHGVRRNDPISVLDAGCGQGFFADLYAREFPQASYTGVDIAPAVVAHLGATRPAGRFVSADMSTWAGPAAAFDVIQCVEVLHLFLDDTMVAATLSNFARMLRPDGVALVTATLLETPIRSSYLDFRDARSFLALVRGAGLRVVREAPLYYWLPDGGPAWRWSRPVFMRVPRAALYIADRAALRLRLPRVATGPDSCMRLLSLAREGRA